MQRISKPTFYRVILVVVVLLSLTRAVTPVERRAASWRETLTELMVSSIAEGHVDGLVSFLFALLGLWMFYEIMILSFGEPQLSMLATTLLAMSNWLIIGTQVMPDVPAASMVLSAVLFAKRYLREGKLSWLVLAMVLTLLGGLTKLPALILLAWIAIGMFSTSKKRLVSLGIALGIATIPCIVYYFVWLPQLVDSGAMALMYPTSIKNGLSQVFGSHLSNSIDMILYRGWGGYFLSILGLLGSVFILFYKERSAKDSRIELVLLYGASLLGLLVFSAKAGATLATHPYYAIPFLPLIALGGATLLKRMKRQQLIYLACLIALVEIGIRHFAKDKQGRAFAELSQRNEGKLQEGPYISGFNLNPQPAYYFNRPTWAWSIENINDQGLRKAAQSEGAVGLIVSSADTNRLNFAYEVLDANSKIAIVNFN